MKKNQSPLFSVILLLLLTVLLSFCSSTEGNVKFAGESLSKAKNNQGPELAQSDYTEAENAYQSAQRIKIKIWGTTPKPSWSWFKKSNPPKPF
jgi:hypothetical protein